MLKQAILYKEELTKKYIEAMCDDHFKFYNSGSNRSFTFSLVDNDYWTIQRVSVDKDNNVIGFMGCDIARDDRVMRHFGLMNFTKQPNITFARDVLDFLRELRDTYNASKFEFVAYEGGHPEIMYRKFIKKHGGRIVGTLTDTQILTDGKSYNSTLFEIMRKDMKF